ncbi:MAG: hypothetical protein JNL97_16580 [Verrucomicrobiales bacterium]|nr:hypothetical protein [Verrucomicrobiales bacterium]
MPARSSLGLAFALAWLAASFSVAAEARWWKGNLHTHSLWSDGDDFPEMIAGWYKTNGYHFLAFTEHNAMAEGLRWFAHTPQRGGGAVLDRYLERFGPDWVETRVADGTNYVRLKPLSEFRGRFEEPDRFLFIAAQEITDRYLTAPIHINAAHVLTAIPPQGGTGVVDVIQRNVDAVLAQRARTGQPMFPHVNHPNYGWAITAEELMQIRGENFFEVYNGHPSVQNLGDASHAGMERVWDIVLTWRLAVLGLPPMYGLAVDDSHNYHAHALGKSNPGRGWVVVRAPFLTPEHIVRALEAGDFYASSGVALRDIRRRGSRIEIAIDAQPGVTYRTRFVGTRKGFDASNEPVRTAQGDALRITHRYGKDVGAVLAEVEGTNPEYTFRGDEWYVRATVVSSRPKANPAEAGEFETAWTQPFLP